MFGAPSAGAMNASCRPDGDSCGRPRAGAENRTWRGMRRGIGNPSRDGEETLADQGTDQHKPAWVVELTGDVTACELSRLCDEAQFLLERGREPDRLAMELQPRGRAVGAYLAARAAAAAHGGAQIEGAQRLQVGEVVVQFRFPASQGGDDGVRDQVRR